MKKRFRLVYVLLWMLVITGACFTAAGERTQAEEAVSGAVTIRLRPMKGTVAVRRIPVDPDGRIGTLPKAERGGYRFQGWYTKKSGGKKVSERTKVSSLKKKTLYAHWKLRKYRIRYEYNGGTLKKGAKNPKTYTVKKKVKLKKPVKDGYVFAGWYLTEDFAEGTRIRSIRKGTFGRLTLYAKFDPVTYYIRFKGNGVLTSVPETMTCYYGTDYPLPACGEEIFDHWCTDKNDLGENYQPGQRVKNLTEKHGKTITLYASAFGGRNNIEKLVRYLVRAGFTKEAAAAVAGNLMWESGGGPADIRLNAVEKSTGRGVGMVQWTNTADSPRRTNFVRYCAAHGKPWPNKDLKVQIDFLMEELKGTYGKTWVFSPKMGYSSKYNMTFEAFKKCRDVSKATRVFCACFERPYARNAHMLVRIAYAKIALAYLK